MKTGRSITDLAAEIERQATQKRDFLAKTSQLDMKTADGESRLGVVGVANGSFAVTPLCHEQIAERIGVPIKYYRRMQEEAPALLDRNVNHWLQEKVKKQPPDLTAGEFNRSE